MFSKFIAKFGFAMGCFLALAVFLGLIGISFLCTAGLVYLIMLCFGLTFNWGIAAGVWLCLWVTGTLFNRN